jgi:putative glutamine amidotransferase
VDQALAQLAGCDGVVLTGGPDVDWNRYAPHNEGSQPAFPQRDEVEIAIALAARERRIPLLAICRGMQVLNVAAKGALVQDIPSQVGRSVDHSDHGQDKDAHSHTVELQGPSRLASLMKEHIRDRVLTVNSRHHQAARLPLAQGFHVTALSTGDGVVEAMEPDDAAWWCVAVQWHPENFCRDPWDFLPLFEDLVRASRNRPQG